MRTTGRADDATREALEKQHEGRALNLSFEDPMNPAPTPRVVGTEPVVPDGDAGWDDPSGDEGEEG